MSSFFFPSSLADALIRYRGLGGILVAILLIFLPNVFYGSFLVRAVASYSGLHLSSPGLAPGSNQTIARMVAVISVGQVVASFCGPAARIPLFAMNLTWAVLGLITCASPHSWGLDTASLLTGSLDHIVFCIALYLTDSSLGGRRTKGVWYIRTGYRSQSGVHRLGERTTRF